MLSTALEIIYFIIIAILYGAFTYFQCYKDSVMNTTQKIKLFGWTAGFVILSGLIYLGMKGICGGCGGEKYSAKYSSSRYTPRYTTDPSSNSSQAPNQLCISAGKLCRGGAYMHQGNTATGKMCQELAKTQAGRAEIDRYDCGTGFEGMPGCGFKYTTISNDCWQNERCQGCQGSCNDEDNGIF